MPDVLILADSPAVNAPPSMLLPFVEMKRAILADSSEAAGSVGAHQSTPRQVDILFASELQRPSSTSATASRLLCPLTLKVPDDYAFPGTELFRACADLAAMRQRVAAWHYTVGEGTYWQPLVWTVKGILFAEAIAMSDRHLAHYFQPFHLQDAKRQPLYALGQKLLRSLAACPGVYLMQFGINDHEVWFDRLIPFPGLPAIASVGVQTPDLFECHWKCLSQQPIWDLKISG